jgi:hypothetical protein
LFKKPIMSSRVAIAATGREVQVAAAAYPRMSFRLSYGDKSWLRERTQNITPWAPLNAYTELEQISGLYLACQGPYGEFYYKDPDDYSRGRTFLGVGDGVNRLFPVSFLWGSRSIHTTDAFRWGLISVQTVWMNNLDFGPTS